METHQFRTVYMSGPSDGTWALKLDFEALDHLTIKPELSPPCGAN